MTARLIRPALMALALMATACQAPPAPVAPAARSVQAPDDLDGALARRDWTAASRLARAAVARDPASVRLHYALAVSASYLNAREEASREFRWVMEHAASGSEEARIARAWLAEAGELKDDGASAMARPRQAGEASLSGTVTWADAGRPPAPKSRQVLLLIGLEGPTRGVRYRVRSGDDGRYEFPSVVPGEYRLTDAIAGPPLWRLRVALEPGQAATLDLSPGNRAAVRDDFPEPGGR